MSDAEPVRRRLRIEGRVQGVSFRYSTAQVARRLGLGGYVRNLPDGSVEAAFEGPPGPVAEAEAFCQTGPRHARVDRVEARDEATEGATEFEIR